MSNSEEQQTIVPQATETTQEEETKQEEPSIAEGDSAVENATTTDASVSSQQPPKKSKYLKRNFQYCKNYDDINQIVKAFPALSSLLTPLDLENIPNALCYVIRSNNDDDVHKAIKYGIWTSVPGNNAKLKAAWETAQQLGVEVYLFFSVVKSGQFNGVARLKSSFQDETFSYWWQPHKFKGHFKVEWVFVKDVKQKQFEGLKNCQGDDISRSKDCTELNYESTGKKMLQIFQEAPARPSIFNYFKFFDQHEQGLRRHYTYIGNQNNMNNMNKGMLAGNPHLANAIPNQNALFYPQVQFPYPFYNKKMFNQPQFIQQMTMMPAQFTPEQFSSMQNLCETHIYPPSTNFQPQQQQQQQQQQHQQHQQQQQHQHHNPKNFNNNYPNGANNSHRRNNNQNGNGKKPNYHKNEKTKQPQLPTQDEMPRLDSIKSPVQEQ